MQWLNKPSTWSADDGILTVDVEKKTDFWRKTHDSGIRDNGHFYFERVESDFSAAVEVVGQYEDQYDQAGLMVRLDEATWIKTGVELKDGFHYASVVVTREWSDWSVVRMDRPSSIWFRVARRHNTLQVDFSADGQAYQLLRQAFLTESSGLCVGPMAAAPKGPGFRAVFKNFLVEQP